MKEIIELYSWLSQYILFPMISDNLVIKKRGIDEKIYKQLTTNATSMPSHEAMVPTSKSYGHTQLYIHVGLHTSLVVCFYSVFVRITRPLN